MLSLDQIAETFRSELHKEPKRKIKLVIEFTNNYFDTIGPRGIPFLNDALALSKRIGYFGGEMLCYCNLLFARFISNDVTGEEIGKEMNRIYSLLPKIKDQPYEYSYSLNLLGYLHWFRGDFDKGFDSAFESLKLIDQLKDYKEAGWIYYALGVFYFDTKDLANSEKNYAEALKIFHNLKYDYGIARSKNGIASVKIKQSKNKEAVSYLEEAIETYRSGSFYSGLGRALTDLALIQKAEKNYSRTIDLFNESLKIRKEINHTQGLITSYTEIGEVYLILDDPSNAQQNLMEGLKLSNSIGAKYKSIRLHKLLSDIYKKRNDIKSAFEHFEKFHALKSEVLSEESANNIRKMQSKLETEKAEKEAEIERLKNVELKKAYDEIEIKNKEILDSIHYAKRIQSSLLPTEKYIEKNLKRLKK